MDQSSNVKLCECGCGQPAPISGYTDRRKGAIKGQPRRFIHAHNKANSGHRRKSMHYLPEDRGYCTPCWIWQLHVDRGGYGHVHDNGKSRLAHRVMYRRMKGSLSDNVQIDHLCGVRCCVNPDHMEPVSSLENTRRGNRSKLTMEQAEQIRALHARTDMTFKEIASRYDVSDTAIINIVKNRTWINRQTL